MKAGTYLKSVGSASQEYITFQRNLLYNFKPLQKKDGKTKMFHIFSLYFLQVFFQFSPTFPNDKTELFPSSSVDGCLHEHWDWQDFLLQGMLPVQKFINWLHDFCVNRSCTCCGNISYDISCLCVCACVRMNFSAIYRLVPCLKA